MSYQLQNDESLADGLKRIAEEQVAAAIRYLQSENDRNKGIYQARKCLKKARALLHLLQPQLGALGAEENHRLRDVGRRFGDWRDADMSLEVLESFADHYKRKTTLNPQRKALAEKQAALQQRIDWPSLLATSLDSLSGTCKRIEGWYLHNVSRESLNLQIRKTHKQGRHALHRALQSRSAEDFHELRKSVKRELNQLRLFDSAQTQIDGLKQLSSLLGDHHNLAVLTSNLDNASGRFRSMTRRQQRSYELQILEVASKVYQSGQPFYILCSAA